MEHSVKRWRGPNFHAGRRRPADPTEREIADAVRGNRFVVAQTVVPLMASPTEIEAIAIRSELADGSTSVLIMNAEACASLQSILEDLGAVAWQIADSVEIGGKPN